MTAKLTEVQKRVRRGARWLDHTEPGWADRVEVAELAMNNACRCVLGQVFREDARGSSVEDGFHFGLDLVAKMPNSGSYAEGREALDKRSEWAELHGFDASDNIPYYELGDAWRPEIARRR